ncbi:MAG: nucleotidyltransferase family protein [Gemmatimonadota bacterium]
MSAPAELISAAAHSAGPGVEPHDLRGRHEAQRAWLALLGGDPGAGEGLTDKQWSWLADEATRHHLRGVTYRRMADSPFAELVPGEVRERLRSYYLETATRNALLFRQTSQIVKELATKGIPVLLLKGIHLARFVYAEPGLRSMADIDIMVRREHLAEAERVFIDRGFGPSPRPDLAEWCTWSHHLAKLVKDGAPVMELHWSIQRPASPFQVDLEGLWQRSRAATLDGAPVRLLSSEDLLLHLALHLSHQHRFRRAALKGLMDIATVLAAEGSVIDRQMLAERAIAWGISGHLYTSLRLAADIFAAPVPAALFPTLPRQRADEEIVEVARRYILTPDAVVPTAYLKLARDGSLRERTKLLLGAVFLPRDRMEALYGLRAGTRLVYPYYGWRLVSLIVRRSGLVMQALFRSRGIQRTIDRERDQLLLEQWSSTLPG